MIPVDYECRAKSTNLLRHVLLLSDGGVVLESHGLGDDDGDLACLVLEPPGSSWKCTSNSTNLSSSSA